MCVYIYIEDMLQASGEAPDAYTWSPSLHMDFIIVMIRWTGLAPLVFEFPFPGSLTSASPMNLEKACSGRRARHLTPTPGVGP